MRVVSSGVRPESGCAVTIGAFDGVHLGHQELIARTRRRADELGVASAVVTFDCHPASVVRPESAPKLLTDLEQKLELLEATGVDYTLVVNFDRDRADESATDFVDEVLVDRLSAKAVVIGYDFHFGKARQGNAELLRAIGARAGFQVEEEEPITESGNVVSSTAIRALLMEGSVERAGALLGRPHEVRGLVMMGDGRGRELGYPTANVHVPDNMMLPAEGVYAGEYVLTSGNTVPAAISLGTRPQFYENGQNLLEAHLVDFEGDLYGQTAKIRFSERLRGQQKFDSIEALVAQMDRDVDASRK